MGLWAHLLSLLLCSSWASEKPLLFHLEKANTLESNKNNIPFERDLYFRAKLSMQTEEIIKDGSFSIEMPEGFTAEITPLKINVTSESISYLGRVKEDPNSLLSLLFKNNHMSGSLMVGGQNYQLQNNGTGLHTLSRIKLTKAFLGKEDTFSAPINERAAVSEPSEDNFIDLIIGYTTEAAANADIEETIVSWVAAANQMLADSCVNFRYRLLDTINTGVATGASDASTVLSDLANPLGSYGALHTARDTQGADLVHLIVDTDSIGLCGLAHLGGTGGNFNDSAAFGLSLYGCPSFVLAHELGHNISLRHDRYQQDLQLTEEAIGGEHYGFVDTANQYESIMAYQDQCIENGTYCNRMDKFSNPRISHNGVPFGVDNFSDNADALNRSYPYVANYRPSQGSHSPDINEYCANSGANKDLNCFIATATFGSVIHPKIQVLRNFRDQVLKKFVWGRGFIKIYYLTSPYLSARIKNLPQLKRWLVLPLTGLIFLFENILLVAGCFVLFALFYRRKLLKASFAFLLLLAPTRGQGGVSFAPIDPSEVALNPSVYLSHSTQTLLGASAEMIQGEGDPGPLSKVEARSTPTQAYFGFHSNGFAANLRYQPESDFKTEITNSPLAPIEHVEKSNLIMADMSFMGFFNLPLGLRVSQQNKKVSTGVTEETESNTMAINIGSGMAIQNLLLGGGLIFSEQNLEDKLNNNQSVKAGWFSAYLALGLDFRGSSTSSSFGGGTSPSPTGGRLELSYQRDPQVIQVENGSQVVQPETSDIHFRFQYSYPLWSAQFLFSVDHQIYRTQEVEVLLPAPIGFDKTAIGLGYRSSSWALNSNIYMQTQTAGFERQDFGLRVALTIFFEGSSTVSSF